MRRPLDVLPAAIPEDPPLDTALSAALLAAVAAGERPESLRLARPGAMVSFGRLDALAPGYDAAVAAAEARGFGAIHRVGGGRAAVFHEDTILFGHAVADPDPRAGTHRRFAAMGELLRSALARLGVDAAVGALPGEYCPGDFSLHAGGIKLVGIAQRVIRGGAWTEGVIVVRGGERVRDVLVPVYRHLGLDWDPATAGALDDLVPGLRFEDALAAVRAQFAEHFALRDAEADAPLLAAARARREARDAAASPPPPAAGRGKLAVPPRG